MLLHVKQAQDGNVFHVDRCQAIFGCHMMSTYIPKQSRKFSPSLRYFICLMPKIQIFGNIWITDYIFHVSSGFGSQPISAEENGQILAAFSKLT